MKSLVGTTSGPKQEGKHTMDIKQVYAHYLQPAPPQGEYRFCPSCGARTARIEEGHLMRPGCPVCGFRQYRNPAPTVSVLVVEGGRVLLGRRGGDPGKGTWSLPSGYIEFGDDFLTTAVRETAEETGLKVELRSLLNVVSSFVSPRFHFLNLFLVAQVVGGELQAGDDLEAVAWYPLAGPYPPMGFPEDEDALHLLASGFAGLPVDPAFTGGTGE